MPTEPTINNALISLSRSFLQYVAESWPWVDVDAQQVEDQLQVLAARQRQDVGDIVQLLTDRDWFIDFGTYPTEYTDLHFISLASIFDWLLNGQSQIADRLAEALTSLKEAGDTAASELLETVALRQNDLASAIKELQQELAGSAA